MAEVYIGRQVRAGASGNDRLFEVDGFHRFVATDFQPVRVNKRSTAVDQVYPVAGVELGAQLYLLANDLLGVLQHTGEGEPARDRKSTRLNSSHVRISYAVFCL